MNLRQRALMIFCGGLISSALMAADAPSMETGSLQTRWASLVSTTNVHQEYPRPQFVREHWQNLNGLWDYAITTEGQKIPKKFDGQILVPFPVESSLSGVKRQLDEHGTLWYRRRFTVPPDWRGQSVELNFGAVNWAAAVMLNGREIGSHRGGYDAFGFDLTPWLHWKGENELVIAVKSSIEGDHPRGKQSANPEGVFYSSSSGIWQTVWLEPVPPVHLTELKLTPELDAEALRVCPMANTFATNAVVETVVYFQGREVGRATGAVGINTTVNLKLVRPWSPTNPDLYDVVAILHCSDDITDEVKSYFGLREIRVGADEQRVPRLFLNGQPLFEIGVMDQGFWPDGLYTAPSDEAIRSDLETAKRLGFNLIRKHEKVESERWYYWADKLGLLIWQDMPSGNNLSEEGRQDFKMELERMLRQRANHPSIVMWILFNEGWGQFDTERLAQWLKAVDPTRLVDNASGWTDAKAGDVIDIHIYPEPRTLSFEGTRAGVLGEFGGLGLGVPGHTWTSQVWGYQMVDDSEELTSRYVEILGRTWKMQKEDGLAAAVYTQLTDVEFECNGLLTYDRSVLKVDASRLYEANTAPPAAIAQIVLLPNALHGNYVWRYTTNAPSKEWMHPSFNAGAWFEGNGGFGSPCTPGAIIKTTWTSADIWLQREFTLADLPTHPLSLLIHHDEDAEVYLNGVLAVHLLGYTVGYVVVSIPQQAQSALHLGRNVIAVHCHQTIGGQYIDVGILEEAPRH